MIVENKGKFSLGALLMVGFVVVLILIFMPIFNGINGLEYLDNLYNSIAKGSAYYIPKTKEDITKYNDNTLDVTIELHTPQQSQEVEKLFSSITTTQRAEKQLTIKGKFGAILNSCIDDADKMYHNQGDKISAKYGYDEQRVLFNWYDAFHIMEKTLKKKKKFKEAQVLNTILEKCVEPAYNFYRIKPQKISEKIGVVFFSLVFYVIYTLWFGYAIMLIFEGMGLKFGH